jgi:hypothetical protein
MLAGKKLTIGSLTRISKQRCPDDCPRESLASRHIGKIPPTCKMISCQRTIEQTDILRNEAALQMILDEI